MAVACVAHRLISRSLFRGAAHPAEPLLAHCSFLILFLLGSFYLWLLPALGCVWHCRWHCLWYVFRLWSCLWHCHFFGVFYFLALPLALSLCHWLSWTVQCLPPGSLGSSAGLIGKLLRSSCGACRGSPEGLPGRLPGVLRRCSGIWKPLGGKLGGSSYPPGVANTLRSESVNHNNGLDVLKRKLLNTNSGGSSAQRCLEGGAVALRPRWWVFSKGDKKIAKVHSCRCPRKRILVNNKYLGSHTLQTFGPSMIHVRCCRCCCSATVLLDKSAATDGSTATTDY